MMKLIKKHLLNGVIWGCIAIVVNIMMFDLMDFDFLPNIFDNFSKFALWVIIICIGFISTGGIVYEIKKLHFRLKLLIHMVIVIGTLLIIGFSLNILSIETLPDIAINVILNALIILAIWTFYYIRDKREIEVINERIKEKKSQRELDIE